MANQLPKIVFFFGKLGRTWSKIFGDRVRSGLGIEKAVESEAGRARRWQHGAKIGPKKMFFGQKTDKKLAIILVTPSTLRDTLLYSSTLADIGRPLAA